MNAVKTVAGGVAGGPVPVRKMAGPAFAAPTAGKTSVPPYPATTRSAVKFGQVGGASGHRIVL